jgi:hypothetical protein
VVGYYVGDMEITPLALVVLLGFGLLIALCLTAWTALSLDRVAGQNPGAERAPVTRQPGRAISNDEVRGARARAERQVERGGRSEPEVLRAEPPTGSPVEPGRAAAQRAEQKSEQKSAGRGADAVEVSSGGSWRSVGRRETPRPEPGGRVMTRLEPNQQARREETRQEEKGREEKGREEDAFERFLKARPDDFDLR